MIQVFFNKWFGLLAICVVASGCGSGEFPVAPVKGVVMCDGKPVPGGLVFFEPKMVGDSAVVGKIGLGVIDEQGNFTISTYADNDGAVIGSHSVKVEKGSGPGCDCAMNALNVVTEVEVTEGGENTFEIVLPKRTRSDQMAEADEDEEDDEDDD